MKNVFIKNKYKALKANLKSAFDKKKPTVHRGGIKAVAIATPKITLAIVPLLALAITKAKPPKKAIKTSRISGDVRAKSSEDVLDNGKR